ncbi:hypothetical protein ABEB36_010796 [Hypothenemus hampei]|uniref:MADF domain-containing protein n=1 Tax=Hypothenemus hampei TaxID=57062 RepID=A0ABD1EDT7_HYPHA
MSDSEFQVLFCEEQETEIIEIDVSVLVETIQHYEFVYNMSHPDYKNAKKKQLAWEEIASILNCPVAECQKTWKSLRDRFTKEKNKMKSGSEAPESNWIYFPFMQFYSKYTKPRKTYTSTKIKSNVSTTEKDIPSRPSTSNSMWSTDEVLSPSSSHYSFDHDSEDVIPTIDTAANLLTHTGNPTASEGITKKRKKSNQNDSSGILNLVKDITTSLETITKVVPKSSNANRAFVDYVFMRLQEMEMEVSAVKRQEIFHILES